MRMIKTGFAALALAGAVMFSGASQAAPLGLSAGAIVAGEAQADPNLIQVRRGGAVRGGRVVRGGGVVRGGRVGVVRGGRVVRGGPVVVRRGWSRGGTAAAVGLGILGAAAIAGAASADPYYGRQCWIEPRPVYDRWGNYLGDRDTRVCN